MKDNIMPRVREILGRADALAQALGPRVTGARFGHRAARMNLVKGDAKEELSRFGIVLHGNIDCEFLLPAAGFRLGTIVIHNQGKANTIIIDSDSSPRECNVSLRLQGSFCSVVFADLSVSPVNIATIYMRSDKQSFFWGQGATSVSSRIEMEGVETMVAVGDDCMFSSGIWIRNHDMHAVFDVRTLDVINPPAKDVVLEQHVWLGFETFVLSAPVIGYGSIIGARSFLRSSVPPKSLAFGTPAKVSRSDVSWSRDVAGVSRLTLERLSRLDELPP